MKADTNDYIIKGGQEGKSRLNTLSEVLYPYTHNLLQACGLREGMSFLDAGCGGGNVSLMAAGVVGNGGQVTAVDFDEEIIALARQDAQNADAHNVSFHAVSAYDIDYSNQFDMVYARFLLSHLTQPADVLARMVQSAKPGGRVVVEDIHFSGHFCYPSCSAFDEYVRLFKVAAGNNGQNADIGPSLFSLFQNAGLQKISFDVILPAFNTGNGKWMAWLTLDRIKETLIRQNLATKETTDQMLHELEQFTKDEHTIMSMPHIFRVWGEKK